MNIVSVGGVGVNGAGTKSESDPISTYAATEDISAFVGNVDCLLVAI